MYAINAKINMSEYNYILATEIESLGFKDDGNRNFSKEIDGDGLILHLTDEKTHYELSLLDTFVFELVVLPEKLTNLDQIRELTNYLTPENAWKTHRRIRATFSKT